MTYDSWKLSTPPEYDEAPDREDDQCASCLGRGYYHHNNVEYKCGCWTSDSAKAKWLRKNLTCLASNLAIGAALCRAFGAGMDYGDPPFSRWSPGCGRAAP